MRLTEEAAERIEATSGASLSFRVEIWREHALARKAVVSQEAEVAESGIQLASLDKLPNKFENASMRWSAVSARAGSLRRSPE
jgi:hypothetical protein